MKPCKDLNSVEVLTFALERAEAVRAIHRTLHIKDATIDYEIEYLRAWISALRDAPLIRGIGGLDAAFKAILAPPKPGTDE
jgi:hypothetical protein